MKQNNPTEKTAERSEDQPDFDPDHPVENPHATHDWNPDQAYFYECLRCGARDHWPAARLSCRKSGSRHGEQIALSAAVRLLYLDLDAFAVWWLARETALGLLRPSIAEWRAEFLEWSKGARPDRET